MSIRPAWAIFLFVATSIGIAGVYHSWTLSQSETLQLSGTTGPDLNELSGWLVQGDGAAVECASESTSFKNLRELPPIFRAGRYRRGGDLQIECLKRSAQDFTFAGRFGSKGDSTCGASDCGTNEEVQVTYNALLDVTDCLEISQREFLPLIASQAGPRLTLMGVETSQINGKDLSEGILKADVWREFQDEWPQKKLALQSNEKPSCRRLGQLFNKVTLPEAVAVCDPATKPQQSLLVLFASAERFAKVTMVIRDQWDPALIDPALSELDARIEDRMILRYWTHLLAYFTTPEEALTVAKDYVDSRNGEANRIHPGELSWLGFVEASRKPASMDLAVPDSWSGYLQKHIQKQPLEKLTRVAQWLNWVQKNQLAGVCSAELWTMESATE